MEERSFRMGINFLSSKNRQEQIPEEFKKIAKDFSEKGFVTTSSENLINWARTGSLHWMTFGLACCAVEMMQTSMPRYDLEKIWCSSKSITKTIRRYDCCWYFDK